MHDREPTEEPPTARALAEVRSPGSGDPSGLTPASETRVVWARGSSAEIDTQLVLAEELGYLTRDELAPATAISDEVGRLLNAVITALHRRLNDQPSNL